MNLRGLGPVRTLVLLNGQRYVPTTALGTVDVAVLPSALIDRVDVVTGGASAAYGSDAVAGVVNFVLDTKLKGLKANLEAGVSKYGDNGSQKASLAYGADLTDNIHLVVSGEYYHTDGVHPRQRDFTLNNTFYVANPNYTATNGQAPLILSPNVYNFGTSFNGVVLNGPFRGTEFLPGGGTQTFDLCSTGSPAFVNCPGRRSDTANFFYDTKLASPQTRGSAYGRLTWQATPSLSIYADGTYGDSKTTFTTIPYLTAFYGALTIRNDNAFLPTAFRTALANQGLTSFTLGRSFEDEGPTVISRRSRVGRGSAGFGWDLGGTFKLDGYATYGESRFDSRVANQPIRSRFNNSIDSVLVNGVPTCRINADAITTNDDSACVPVNLFGAGSPSQAAQSYYLGTATSSLKFRQTAAALNLTGKPFSTWAGPVAIAVGGEYRHESVSQTVDPITQAVGFIINNPGNNFSGSLNVKEVYGEINVPLAKDLPFLRDLSLNGAARYTDYSISGSVTTWKVGGVWAPVDDVRFRATRSRDIRAPNLFELFSSGSQAAQVVSDPKNGGAVAIFPGFVGIGNPNLKPEKADTTSYGVVVQPRFLRGLSVSVDYYNITVNNAIATLTAADLVNRCNAGNLAFCQFIVRTTGDGSTSGTLTRINIPGLNLQTLETSGIDFEASYHFSAGPGQLGLRGLANNLRKFRVSDGRTTTDELGSLDLGLAKWNFDVSATYNLPRTMLLLDAQRIGGGVYSRINVVQNGSIGGVWYLNAAIEQRVMMGSTNFTLYGNVDNLLNQAPPFAFENQLGNYDRIGTTMRIGVRIKM